MWLFSALQSMRFCAAAEPATIKKKKPASLKARIMRVSLLVAQRLHGVEPGGPSSGIEARNQADDESKSDGSGDQPPRYRPEMFRRKRLALEVNVGSQIDHLANRPAQRDSHDTAQNSHGSSFGEEKFLHVSVAGANGLHDADLAAAFQDCHHQRVHNSDRCNGKGKAAEDSEEQVEHREELAQTSGCVEN